jgi:hypothetical protein
MTFVCVLEFFLSAKKDVSARFFVFCACVSLTQRLIDENESAISDGLQRREEILRTSKEGERRCVVCSCRAVRVP